LHRRALFEDNDPKTKLEYLTSLSGLEFQKRVIMLEERKVEERESEREKERERERERELCTSTCKDH
jgi:hypothetical protein